MKPLPQCWHDEAPHRLIIHKNKSFVNIFDLIYSLCLTKQLTPTSSKSKASPTSYSTINMKLIETLLIALLPLFAATSAAHAGVTPPEHEIERKLRGSDNNKAEGFDILTSLLLQDKPKKPTMKGAEGALAAADHAHGGRMLKGSSSSGDDGSDEYAALVIGVAAAKFVGKILDLVGVTQVPGNEAAIQQTIGQLAYGVLTKYCTPGTQITYECVHDSVSQLFLLSDQSGYGQWTWL